MIHIYIYISKSVPHKHERVREKDEDTERLERGGYARESGKRSTKPDIMRILL